MARPVTLFTGQWADLPLTELAPLAKKMGFDGLELACWGDHFDVYKAAESGDYCRERWKILGDAVSAHLVFRIISSGRRSAITSTSAIEEFFPRRSGATATRKAFASGRQKI